ncbi:MAG TPA: KTSC domain-containing protein [Mucilaginibacter sp.]|nr:KTSC domain-containing protein [Mucilaginibacter sp.]
MKRHRVNSTALQSVGYDPERKVLELEFRDNGAVWQYFKLPPAVYDKFIHAESLGNYFVTRIKGKYPEEQVEYPH